LLKIIAGEQTQSCLSRIKFEVALLVIQRQFMFAVGLFKEMLIDHVFKIIES
jgi:hypothetical protein